MGKILTSDGVESFWPWSEAGTTSLSADELEALLDPVAINRIVAHRDLANYQLIRLYSTSHGLKRAKRMQRCALRITEHRLVDLCSGMGEGRICDIVSSSNDRTELELRLLEEIHRPRRNVGYMRREKEKKKDE